MKAHPETRGLLENPEKVIQGGDLMKSPILLLILFFSFILSACGSDCGDVSAPPDATIEIQPLKRDLQWLEWRYMPSFYDY
jgi:hypothetical protein